VCRVSGEKDHTETTRDNETRLSAVQSASALRMPVTPHPPCEYSHAALNTWETFFAKHFVYYIV
jgi:hypothetical protein